MWLKKQMDALRKLGPVGKALAAVIQFIFFANPGVTWTVIVTFVLAKFTAALQWAQEPIVYSSAGIFIFLLWTWIGIAVLRDRQKTRTVRIAHDYAYSLIQDGGWQGLLALDDQSRQCIVILLQLRNTGVGPVRIQLEEFRVVLDNRVNVDVPPNLEITLPRAAAKSLRTSPILRDISKTVLTGDASCKLLYGAPGEKPTRKFTLKAKLTVNISPMGTLVMDDAPMEHDDPYVSG